MDSGTEIWYENRSAHARPPTSFCSCQNHECVFANYRPCRCKNERVKQPISAPVGDVMYDIHVHVMCTVTHYRSFFNLRNCKWGELRTDCSSPRIRRCSICKSSVMPKHHQPIFYLLEKKKHKNKKFPRGINNCCCWLYCPTLQKEASDIPSKFELLMFS